MISCLSSCSAGTSSPAAATRRDNSPYGVLLPRGNGAAQPRARIARRTLAVAAVTAALSFLFQNVICLAALLCTSAGLRRGARVQDRHAGLGKRERAFIFLAKLREERTLRSLDFRRTQRAIGVKQIVLA